MNLIVIYGPPAVGKLTIAKALATLTGYTVFHNHMTVDVLDSLIGYGRRGFFQLLDRVRLVIFEGAARAKVPGIIFTFVYAHPHDIAFVRQMIRAVGKHGGHIHFVWLSCSPQVLSRRVGKPSRRHFGKIRTVSALKKNLAEANIVSEIPGAQSLHIDTTRMSPNVAAKNIVKHFHLPLRSPR